MPFLSSIHLRNFLSFGENSGPIGLKALNVLIGPNGSGKSNLIEALELLSAAPKDLADPIRDGGGVTEWLWKGGAQSKAAIIETELADVPDISPRFPLRYLLSFDAVSDRLEVVDEVLEETEKRDQNSNDVFFYYRYQGGRPAISTRYSSEEGENVTAVVERRLKRESLLPDQSVLSQRKDPDLYPEVTKVAEQFGKIQIFREWAFGRFAPIRQSQPTTLPNDVLLPDASNLALVLNHLEHSGKAWQRLLDLCRKFLPHFRHLSVRIESGRAQLYLHEDNLKYPVPGTRLSDGTIRFLCLLAILLNPRPAPLICIEEPELGLHPDAILMLADLIREASKRTQIIVTTHSDLFVNALSDQPESVLVCEQAEETTTMERLEPEALQEWLKCYRLGELWIKGEIGGVRW